MENKSNGVENPNHLLKADQVAERLRISRARAYRLMQNGEIPTVRFSRIVRVSETDLENFILQHKSR